MASRFFGSDLAAIDDLSISMGATVVLEPSTWISGLGRRRDGIVHLGKTPPRLVIARPGYSL